MAIRSDAVRDSVNFLWFKERYANFIYVDRVVVAADARRMGVASRLYDDVEDHARASDAPLITCEINLRPPNPDSIAFHDRHDFIEALARLHSA